MKIEILAKEIHANAVAKGWYEGEVNIGERFALIHSELSEALEAARVGKFYNNGAIMGANQTLANLDMSGFLALVKGTFEDELADVVIRILDLCEYLGATDRFRFAYEKVLTFDPSIEYPWSVAENIGSFVCHLHVYVSDTFDTLDKDKDVDLLAVLVKFISLRLGAETLETHMRLKMEYNKTRPYKHGKKF